MHPYSLSALLSYSSGIIATRRPSLIPNGVRYGLCTPLTLHLHSTRLSSSYAVHSFPAWRPLVCGLGRSPMFSSPLCLSRRHARVGGRSPTYTEITEACATLGVEADCDPKQLKKLYRDLVKKNHPDAGGDAAAMSRITVAYDRLSGLSTLEKEQFRVQRNAYRGGSYHTGNGLRYAARNHASHSAGNSAHGFYDTSAQHDFFRQGAAQSHGYYNYKQRNTAYGENPFASKYPFSFHTQMRRAWTMPMGTLLLRGFVLYLALSIGLLLVYRRLRDWQHDDGWKMAESLARHEQLSELQRIRQEMNERMRAAREAAAAHRAFAIRPDAANDVNSSIHSNGHSYGSNGRELRALEYARRRQIELKEEVKGWPEFGEEKGKLIHRAQDPPGVVFFEPRKEDIRHRQVVNMRKGQEWSAREGQKPAVPNSARESASDAGEESVQRTRNDADDAEKENAVALTGTRIEMDAIDRIKSVFGALVREGNDSDTKTTT